MPLLIDFASPTSLLQEPDRTSDLPIFRNGPPGTFVLFPDGVRVSLPTDQIVFAEDTGGHVRVGFGGMRFVGLEAKASKSRSGLANVVPQASRECAQDSRRLSAGAQCCHSRDKAETSNAV